MTRKRKRKNRKAIVKRFALHASAKNGPLYVQNYLRGIYIDRIKYTVEITDGISRSLKQYQLDSTNL